MSYPLLDLRVLRSRDFALGIITQWAAIGTMFGTFFMVPLFLQQVAGYGTFKTGLTTLPQAIAAAVFMQIGGRVFDRLGPRPPVIFGVTLMAGAMWLMSGISGGTTGRDLILPLVLMGGGMGSMMMSLNTHLLNSAPRELVSRVTSLTSALQSVVASLAIATYVTILQSRIPVHLAEAAASAAGGRPAPDVLRNALALAFGDVYRTALLGVALAFVLATTLRGHRPAPASAVSESPAGAPVDVPEREPVAVG